MSIVLTSFADKRRDIIHSDQAITWLGLDFTMTRFIGSATQYKEMGEITPEAFRDKYVNAWNELFVNEPKKFDVAKYVHRASVRFALDVSYAANNRMRGDVFSEDPNDYLRLTEADITKAVKKYDFKGQSGTGMLVFIEGMSKGREEASGWITFVDMDSKTVLQTVRAHGAAGGFGFRNYWAKAFLNILKRADN